ncbi:anosmin-1-like isoform X3 [Antechinus flavipes]|uniref:anosmin-1-like isoform X3 n=1 Tax=Antechinus flavipes TaxID=38775 RepID=UPI0022362959|nr:anosmin-1-like isoform X3 [Antechinus flavipes]
MEKSPYWSRHKEPWEFVTDNHEVRVIFVFFSLPSISLSSLLLSFLSSFSSSFPPSLLPSLLPSFLPSLFPSSFLSFLPLSSLLFAFISLPPSFLPSSFLFLSSFLLPSFFPSSLPSFPSSFLPSLSPSFLPSSLPPFYPSTLLSLSLYISLTYFIWLSGVPLKPRKGLVILERSSGAIQVSWKPKSSVSIEPVFYILQSRWHWGLHPSEDEATEWEVVAVTMEESAQLDDLGPNRWYQFRVAAVNAHGTRGFTPPSKHVQSSRVPLPPGSPQNLRKGNVTTNRAGTHSIVISWDPPPQGVLAVHHYRVLWRPWTPGAHGPSPKLRSQRVAGAKPEVQLHGLGAGTAYQRPQMSSPHPRKGPP